MESPREAFWVLVIGSTIAGLVWLGRLLKEIEEDKELNRRNTAGGLIVALGLGFSVAAILYYWLGWPQEIVWAFCVVSGYFVERTLEQLSKLMAKKTGFGGDDGSD